MSLVETSHLPAAHIYPSHLTKLYRSREQWIVFTEEAVRDCIEHLRDIHGTAIAIFLLKCLRLLKSVTDLAEIGSRAVVAECLGLKPCWEWRVPRISTMDGRRSHSRIFAVREKQRNWEVRAALFTRVLYLQYWVNDGVFPYCRDVYPGN